MAKIRSSSDVRTKFLDEGWEVAPTDPGAVTTPAELDRTPFVPATVPGTAAEALRRAGQWDFERPRDFDASDWWFRVRFAESALSDIAARGSSGVTTLRLDGIASIADVWLNGVKIAETDNMFRAHAIDVGAALRDDNELAIRCRSLAALVRAKKGRPRWKTRLVDQQQLRWFRTTLLGRIPGWTPPVAAVGPWRPVCLERREHVSLERASVRAVRDGAGGRMLVAFAGRTLGDASVTAAHLSIAPPRAIAGADKGNSGSGASGVAGSSGAVAPDEADRDVAARRPLTLSRAPADPRAFRIDGEVRLDRVESWWPHTHGAQPLYSVILTLRVGDRDLTFDCGKVGFRDVDLVTKDGAFEVRVNGEPIFCRGACWTTTDVVTLDGTGRGAASALDLARDAGMNMIRVGGTMVYESDAFYDACDERGIVVWQDFMFANMDYPADDDAFRANVVAEAHHVLGELETRPSLAVLCGNSEIEQQIAMLGLSRDLWQPKLFYETLPAIAREVRPDVPYVASTPTGGALPFAVDTGLSHYYGVGAYLRPLEDARRAGVRFTSECLGFSNVPEDSTIDLVLASGQAPFHHPRWKARVPRDSGPGWDFEDVRDHYLALLFGVEPAKLRYADTARYLALSRVTTGEVMARTIAEWRRPASPCRGAIIWFYRDLWPGAGWGVVDATGMPKAAYYYVKRASKNVALLVTDEGLNGLGLHVVNETAATLACEVRLALYRDGETLVASGTKVEHVPPRAGTALRGDALLPSFVDLTYAYRFGPPAHDVTVATLVDGESGRTLDQAFHFPAGLGAFAPSDIGLEGTLAEIDGGRCALTVRTRRLALAVSIVVEGCVPDDNYFHLAPGSERTVILARSSGQGRPQGWLSALNARSSVRLVANPPLAPERSS
jgi:beta-mannosidase